MTGQNQLKGDALSWLLEIDQDNPGVRFFALRDLLGRPMDDVEVQAAQASIMRTGPVPAILAAQYPAGYWGEPRANYSPKYRASTWQILFLAELGADPADERVRRGGEHVLSTCIAANGAFSAVRPPAASGAVPCLNGNIIWALHRLGFGDDRRVQAAVVWQAQSVTGESGFRYIKSGTSGPLFACSANLGQPCGWGAAKAMRGLLEVPPEQRSPAIQHAIDAGAAFLLSRDPALADYPHTERVSSTWFKLGFPLSYWSDVLEVASVLVEAGYGQDPRLRNALNLILSKQDAQGRWRMDNSLNGKMWVDVEAKGQPSKWVTLRALRVLGKVPDLAT